MTTPTVSGASSPIDGARTSASGVPEEGLLGRTEQDGLTPDRRPDDRGADRRGRRRGVPREGDLAESPARWGDSTGECEHSIAACEWRARLREPVLRPADPPLRSPSSGSRGQPRSTRSGRGMRPVPLRARPPVFAGSGWLPLGRR